MQFLAVFLGELVLLYLLSRKIHLGVGRFFYKLTRRESWTVYLLAIVFLPGTFVHEIAHFLTALFLLVPVGSPELMPELHEGNSVKLGSVPIGKTDPLRRFLVGIAPMIFGNVLIFLVSFYIVRNQNNLVWWHIALAAYLVFEVGNTMFASKADLKGAWVILLLVAILIVTGYVLGLRFSPSFEAMEVFRNASFFLAVPVIINMVFLLIFKKFKLI